MMKNYYKDLKTKKQKQTQSLTSQLKESQDKIMATPKQNDAYNIKTIEALDFLAKKDKPLDEKRLKKLKNKDLRAWERITGKKKGKAKKLTITAEDRKEDDKALEELLQEEADKLHNYARKEQALNILTSDVTVTNATNEAKEHMNMFSLTVLQLQKAFSLGYNVNQACRYANISSTTYYRLLKQYPQLEGVMVRASHDLQMKCIKTINIGASIDPTLALQVLERLNPKEWSKSREEKAVKDNTSKTIVNNILLQLKEKPENVLEIMKQALGKPVTPTIENKG